MGVKEGSFSAAREREAQWPLAELRQEGLIEISEQAISSCSEIFVKDLLITNRQCFYFS